VLFAFCRELENLFHGESSGVDVAVAIEARGLHFKRFAEEGDPTNGLCGFDPVWQPCWYISYSGARGVTSDCVAQVKAFIAANPAAGAALDKQMEDAVRLAEATLRDDESSNEQRLIQLSFAIEKASACFVKWGLSSGELGKHLEWLRQKGAIAVKPTGSGGGGYALSLWRKAPPPEIENLLIPVFRS
jgi:mevalonate kinase